MLNILFHFKCERNSIVNTIRVTLPGQCGCKKKRNLSVRKAYNSYRHLNKLHTPDDDTSNTKSWYLFLHTELNLLCAYYLNKKTKKWVEHKWAISFVWQRANTKSTTKSITICHDFSQIQFIFRCLWSIFCFFYICTRVLHAHNGIFISLFCCK